MATSNKPTMAASPTTTIPAYKTVFLQSCLSAEVLTFGSFTLKSGRRMYPVSSTPDFHPVLASASVVAYVPNFLESPYFFNAGTFHTAPLLSAISTAYANTIISFLSSNPSIPKPDVIFG